MHTFIVHVLVSMWVYFRLPPTSLKHALSECVNIHACVFVCVHCAVWWTGFPFRVCSQFHWFSQSSIYRNHFFLKQQLIALKVLLLLYTPIVLKWLNSIMRGNNDVNDNDRDNHRPLWGTSSLSSITYWGFGFWEDPLVVLSLAQCTLQD